jgi:hypothetical protein
LSSPLTHPSVQLDPQRASKDNLILAVGDLQALVRSLWDRVRVFEQKLPAIPPFEVKG